MKDVRTDEQVKGQDGTCATVLVKAKDGGTMRINAHEYDEETHGKIVKKEAPGEGAADVKPPAPTGDGKVNWKSKTKDELIAHLTEKNVAYNTDANKAELVALCEANP